MLPPNSKSQLVVLCVGSVGNVWGCHAMPCHVASSAKYEGDWVVGSETRC